MAGGFCIEDVPGIHCLPAAIRHELDLFRVVIFLQVPPDYPCQPFLVYRFEQVVERAGVKAVENIIPVSSDIPESVKLVVKSHAHFALFCSEISLTTAE